MVWRNIRVQFDEMYLGFLWAVTRPLAMVTVFVLLRRFSQANMYVNIPYSVYVYSGLILWFYFLEATDAASDSVTKDAGLIKKIYYPRLITPIVPVLSGFYSFAIAVVPLVIMMIFYGVAPGIRIVLLPVVILQCMVMCLGVGTMFASLTFSNKDWDRFLGLLLYLGLFVSPVIFSPDMIPHRARMLYFMNPMAGTLLAFRSCMFDNFPFPLYQWIYSLIFSVVALVIGSIMFRRAEVIFADKL